jgi:hypothetical protein
MAKPQLSQPLDLNNQFLIFRGMNFRLNALLPQNPFMPCGGLPATAPMRRAKGFLFPSFRPRKSKQTRVRASIDSRVTATMTISGNNYGCFLLICQKKDG